jgi:hypothetical protein
MATGIRSRFDPAPEVHCMGLQKDLRRPSPFIVQKREEFPFRVELGGGAELRHHLARDAVDAHTGPLRALAVTRIGDLPKERHHAQLFQEKETSFRRLRISEAERAGSLRSTGLI